MGKTSLVGFLSCSPCSGHDLTFTFTGRTVVQARPCRVGFAASVSKYFVFFRWLLEPAMSPSFQWKETEEIWTQQKNAAMPQRPYHWLPAWFSGFRVFLRSCNFLVKNVCLQPWSWARAFMAGVISRVASTIGSHSLSDVHSCGRKKSEEGHVTCGFGASHTLTHEVTTHVLLPVRHGRKHCVCMKSCQTQFLPLETSYLRKEASAQRSKGQSNIWLTE